MRQRTPARFPSSRRHPQRRHSARHHTHARTDLTGSCPQRTAPLPLTRLAAAYACLLVIVGSRAPGQGTQALSRRRPPKPGTLGLAKEGTTAATSRRVPTGNITIITFVTLTPRPRKRGRKRERERKGQSVDSRTRITTLSPPPPLLPPGQRVPAPSVPTLTPKAPFSPYCPPSSPMPALRHAASGSLFSSSAAHSPFGYPISPPSESQESFDGGLLGCHVKTTPSIFESPSPPTTTPTTASRTLKRPTIETASKRRRGTKMPDVGHGSESRGTPSGATEAASDEISVCRLSHAS